VAPESWHKGSNAISISSLAVDWIQDEAMPMDKVSAGCFFGCSGTIIRRLVEHHVQLTPEIHFQNRCWKKTIWLIQVTFDPFPFWVAAE